MRNNETAKLFKLVPQMTLFSHYSLDKVATKEGDNMPHLVWPDKYPCLMANLYMLSLRDRPGRSLGQGLSRRGSKGGTMGDYAAKLSQLIRFCYFNEWDFIDITDDKFTFFINSIRAERSDKDPERRKKTETTINQVGRICLDFLSFVGHFHGEPNFVSSQGTIRASRKTISVAVLGRKQAVTATYWHHHSFSGGERLKKRNPIAEENIQKLRDSVSELGGSRFLQSRRLCLLSILEYTGARRAEVVYIRVSDVKKALNMKYPMLRVITLKTAREGGEDPYRMVPIDRMVLKEIEKYIRAHRSTVIKSKVGKANDHDYLFISETTGKPIREDTVTSDVHLLRKQAGIPDAAHPHMFRHAFITKLFVRLIEQHEFENPDDFRKSLLSSESFKVKVRQWTGHKTTGVLDQYIDLAFAKIAGYRKTVSSVYLMRVVETFDKMSLELLDRLKNGAITLEQYCNELQDLMTLRDQDLEAAKDTEEDFESRPH